MTHALFGLGPEGVVISAALGRLGTKLDVLGRFWAVRGRFASLGQWLHLPFSYALSTPTRLIGRHPRARGLCIPGYPSPFFYRPGTTDHLALLEVILEEEYGFVLAEGLGPVRTILDLGSNVGYSIRFWRQHFPQAAVVGVEPDPANLAVCWRNVAARPGLSRVALVPAFVGGRRGAASVDRSEGAWAATMTAVGPPGTGPIPVLPVMDVLEQTGLAGRTIDLLKCDVEGAEAEIFADPQPWIHQVRNLLVETHPPYSVARLLEDLGRIGSCWRVRVKAGKDNVVFLQRSDLWLKL